jgi:hypothetical protein
MEAQVFDGLSCAPASEAKVDDEGVRGTLALANAVLEGKGLSRPGGRVGAGKRVGSPESMLYVC